MEEEMKEMDEKGYTVAVFDTDAEDYEEDLSEMTDEEYMEIMQ